MSPSKVILVVAVSFPSEDYWTFSNLIGFCNVVDNFWLAGISVVAI